LKNSASSSVKAQHSNATRGLERWMQTNSGKQPWTQKLVP
jgi:hypothetical protein